MWFEENASYYLKLYLNVELIMRDNTVHKKVDLLYKFYMKGQVFLQVGTIPKRIFKILSNIAQNCPNLAIFTKFI